LQGPSEFRGGLKLALPSQIESSECDSSASFALEYEVSLSALIAYHEDVSVSVPVRIEVS